MVWVVVIDKEAYWYFDHIYIEQQSSNRIIKVYLTELLHTLVYEGGCVVVVTSSYYFIAVIIDFYLSPPSYKKCQLKLIYSEQKIHKHLL